jgi:ABC-2 type transport system ATP-binding protein
MRPSASFHDGLPVRATSVQKRFGQKVALRDLTLQVRQGAVLGLTGANGSGKSTALAIFAGYVRATQGQVEIFGRPPAHGSLVGRVGASLDDASFPEDEYVGEYMRYLALLQGLSARDADAALDKLGALRWRSQRFRELSRGMRRAVGIAQACLGEPQLLLLDEPTDGLDAATIGVVRDLLRRDGRATAVLASHDADFTKSVCDEIVCLSRENAQEQPVARETNGGAPMVGSSAVGTAPPRVAPSASDG